MVDLGARSVRFLRFLIKSFCGGARGGLISKHLDKGITD